MKNVKGGYKIISLEENDLTNSFSVNGIYNALSKTYDKTILVSGIVIDGEKKNDAYTEVNVDSTDYKFTVYGYEVTVSSDDSVEAEEVTLEAVTSIGGVDGAITLGSGLSITAEGELSASSEGVKYYKHYYRNPASGIGAVYVVTTNDTLATTKAEFMKIVLSATYFLFFDSGDTLRLGCCAHVSTFPVVDGSGSLYLLGVSNADTPQWNRATITSFSTNASNTVTEL